MSYNFFKSPNASSSFRLSCTLPHSICVFFNISKSAFSWLTAFNAFRSHIQRGHKPLLMSPFAAFDGPISPFWQVVRLGRVFACALGNLPSLEPLLPLLPLGLRPLPFSSFIHLQIYTIIFNPPNFEARGLWKSVKGIKFFILLKIAPFRPSQRPSLSASFHMFPHTTDCLNWCHSQL